MNRRMFILSTSGAIIAQWIPFDISAVVAAAAVPAAAPAGSLPLPRILKGIEVTLRAAHVFGGPATIWANTVRIAEPLRTDGHALRIIAREILFTDAAVIDTRAVGAASPSYPKENRAVTGGNAGDAGLNGADGGRGLDAGDILLIASVVRGPVQILAPGGQGGAAQSGGDGAKGTIGPPQKESCARGIAGGSGGIGGMAGRPGDGGNGGRILVFVDESSKASITYDIAAGAPGMPGVHGRSGKGGDGGPGGPGVVDYPRVHSKN